MKKIKLYGTTTQNPMNIFPGQRGSWGQLAFIYGSSKSASAAGLTLTEGRTDGRTDGMPLPPVTYRALGSVGEGLCSARHQALVPSSVLSSYIFWEVGYKRWTFRGKWLHFRCSNLIIEILAEYELWFW